MQMLKFLRKKIGIIGYGNMGSAIAGRIKAKYRVWVFDKDKEKTRGLKGIQVSYDPVGLIKESDIVILAVKPQDFDALLNEINAYAKDKLIISIAAGIKTSYLEKIIGTAKVVRVMPNIGAIVGKSFSYICKGGFAKESDLKIAVELFSFLGHTFILSEDRMAAATGVGGSGPGFWGYLFDKKPRSEWEKYETDYFIPELTSAAESLGFDKEISGEMARFVTSASISAVDVLHITPGELKVRVASKGGTTEAGLKVLEQGGSLTDAVKAAAERAKELSRG